MAIITNSVSEDKFSGTIHTLTCEVTGKKLVNILVIKENSELMKPVFVRVKAKSPFAPAANSGVHKIGGIIAYGPIDASESNTPTKIDDIEYEVVDGEEQAVIIVKEV